ECDAGMEESRHEHKPQEAKGKLGILSQEPVIPIAHEAVKEEEGHWGGGHDREWDEDSQPLPNQVIQLRTGFAQIHQKSVRLVVVGDGSDPDQQSQDKQDKLGKRERVE